MSTDDIPDHRPTLRDRLRIETAPAHHALETEIAFLHSPSRALATTMMLGFQRVLEKLEPALSALVPDIVAGREKLGLLADNLRTLAPLLRDTASPDDHWLPATRSQAIGALYVLEGSTLGGKVIAKALSRLPDWPLSAHSYFDPYGANTRAKWLEFLETLDTVPTDCEPEVVDGANATFEMIRAAMRAQLETMRSADTVKAMM